MDKEASAKEVEPVHKTVCLGRPTGPSQDQRRLEGDKKAGLKMAENQERQFELEMKDWVKAINLQKGLKVAKSV